MNADLRLGPLPKTAMVKIIITVPENLKLDLDRYAELHSARWGETIDAAALIPHMLQAFVSRDRGFRKVRKSNRTPLADSAQTR